MSKRGVCAAWHRKNASWVGDSFTEKSSEENRKRRCFPSDGKLGLKKKKSGEVCHPLTVPFIISLWTETMHDPPSSPRLLSLSSNCLVCCGPLLQTIAVSYHRVVEIRRAGWILTAQRESFPGNGKFRLQGTGNHRTGLRPTTTVGGAIMAPHGDGVVDTRITEVRGGGESA
jgi:hypothetical protein